MIPRLIHDFKYRLIREEMIDLLQQLSRPEVMADTDRYLEIMLRYKDLSEVERQFAQALGDRVLTTV